MKLNSRNNKRSNRLLVFTIILISTVLYLGNIYAFNTSDIVSAICIVAFPLLNIPGVLAMIAYLIPLNSGVTVLYLYGYAIFVLLLKKGKLDLRVLIPVFAIVIWEVIMAFFVPKVNIMNTIIYTCTVFLLFYLLYTDDADYKICCYAYIAGTMVLLLAVMTTAIQNTSWQEVMSGEVRIGAYEGREALGGTVAVLTENANSLAYYAVVAIILAFSLIKTEKIFGKVVLTVAVLFGTLVGLFTVSRTFMIVLLMGIFLVFTARYTFKQKIILAVVVGAILWVGLPYLLENTQIFDAFESRFKETDMATANGRTDIINQYTEFLWNNPVRFLVGTGAINYREVSQIEYATHNGTQQILVSYGLIGFCLLLYCLLKPITNYFRRNKFSLSKIVPWICVIAFVQTIQFLNPFNLMLPYAIAVMYMKIPEKELKT